MKIVESATITDHSLQALKSMLNETLLSISFEYNCVVTMQNGEKDMQLNCQEMILEFESKEILFCNHYHESVYNTGLQYLIVQPRKKSVRPYPFRIIDQNINSTIDKIEIWGLKDFREYWDREKSVLYYERGIFSEVPDQVQHLISFQHIAVLYLQSGTCILIRSDLPNLIFVDFTMSNNSYVHIESDFYKWYEFT